MKPTRDENGNLLAFAWPGGYPLYYLTALGETFCHACAASHPITACDVNWEDPMLWCEGCSQRIESAYAEDGHPDKA